MTLFVKQGSQFFATAEANLQVFETLPAATYQVRCSIEKGFYLETVDNMTVPSKLYGSPVELSERILRTYDERGCNTGVLLCGEKGTGKTMLARLLSVKLLDKQVPTLLVNQPHSGDAFNAFLASIKQPCLVFFDEFEKVYDRDDQNKVLTLLDGIFAAKKLFVFTCNDRYRINSYMTNRPGRLFYNINYGGLENTAITEYCEDNLQNKDNISGVLEIAATIDIFNFDMLQGLVEEMNRYNETAVQAVQLLNIRPENSAYVQYEGAAYLKSEPATVKKLGIMDAHPLTKPLHIYVDFDDDGDDSKFSGGDSKFSGNVTLAPANLKAMRPDGALIFEQDDIVFTFTKRSMTAFSY